MERAIKILAVLAVVFFCLKVFSDNKADVDLWGNVGFVKAMPWTGEFKYKNTYSFTEPDRPWINHEWLGEYILNRAYTHFGDTGLLVLKVILGLSVVGVIYALIAGACGSGAVIFLWLMLTISTMGYGFSTRPHLFTYLLYAFFLASLLKYNETGGIKYLLALPFLGILWANIHGAFFAGAILLAIYVIFGKKRKPVLAAFLLFIAASFITPYGPTLWKYILYSASKPRPYLSEWAPFTDIAYVGEHIDFVILAVFAFLIIIFSRKKKDAFRLAALIMSFAAAIAMRRNIPLFAIAAGLVVPRYFEDTAAEPVDGILDRFSKPVIATTLSIFLILSLGYAAFFHKTDFLKIEVEKEKYPVGVVSFMKENNISGNALVFFDWAEYSIWKLYPDCRVFIDGRFCAAYDYKTTDDFFNFLYLGSGWENALKNYPTNIVLIHRGNPVYAKMVSITGWECVYGNEIAALFLKREAHKDIFLRLKKGDIRYPQVNKREYFP